MKFASFRRPDGQTSFGSVMGGRITDLGVPQAQAGLAQAHRLDLLGAIASEGLARLHPGPTYALDEITLLPVIPQPGKTLCVGLNYETHRQETGRAEAAHPAIFTRFADTLIAHRQPIVRPSVSSELDYEGELAVVIGRAGRAIPAKNALEYVAGYSCFNDASIRDWQRHNIQFTPGKNFPGTGAFGPWLVTPDEVGDLEAQHVVTRLNGQIVQDQPIRDMIWPVAEIIAYISLFTPLAPGHVIATGTPGGVGAKRQPPLWMKPGDEVEVEIGKVGTLSNPVVDEA